MSDLHKCPAPEQLLAWLDGEAAARQSEGPDNGIIAGHIEGCPACREFISAIQEENDLLCAVLDAVPAPDLTGRVLAGIDEAESSAAGRDAIGQIDTGLLNILSYLVAAGVGLALVLAYSFLPGLINFELRPVAVVQLLMNLDRLAGFIGETLDSIAAQILPGAPLIPPLIIVLIMLLVNMIGKRRISDV